MMGSLEAAAAVAFWACVATVAYTYAVYPALIWAASRAFGRQAPPPDAGDEGLPTMSLVISALNEEAVLEERLDNALAMDYPPGKLEIIVGSDGSTDRTAEIARRFADRGIRLLEFDRTRGKAAVLNAAVAGATGEVVLLSDANTQADPKAARRLARWFLDPGIGVVVGRLNLLAPRSGRNADGIYWHYETFLKRCEARLGALLGANGAIYAVRRGLLEPIPPGIIVDDLVIPLLIRLRTGHVSVFDGDAVASEECPPDVRSEFRRRSRIGAGDFQSLALLWRLLHPRHGWLAFAFLSHKILRWAGPFLLIGALVSNACLWDQPFYRPCLVTQACFYLTPLISTIVPPGTRLPRPLRLAVLFVGMNAALLVGFCRWASGRQGGAWARTARAGEAGGLLR